MKNNLIFLISLFVLLVSCSSLDDYRQVEKAGIYLLPLKSMESFYQDFKDIQNQWEISLIEGSSYDLILELEKLYKNMAEEAINYEYNRIILISKIEHHKTTWGFLDPKNVSDTESALKKLIEFANKYNNMESNLSRLIKKLKAIRKALIKQKLQQKKQEKALKQFKVNFI
ncbi:MAG: hypothetical protein OXJ52_01630 [Oligoflexia bacterium]|nr:hypothetical protein [Oligoflexia bacterium]